MAKTLVAFPGATTLIRILPPQSNYSLDLHDNHFIALLQKWVIYTSISKP